MILHQREWNFLEKSAKLGKISHAYLFSGQKDLGKKIFAIELAKLLNCQSPDSERKPCQGCKTCQAIERETHPDLLLIEPTGNEIKISQVRELIWSLSLKPYSALFKIVIVNDVHLMNKEAQSCFLKTLEEPRGNSILILITPFPEMLLPTILSRVQQIKFQPLARREIEKLLKAKGASPELAEKIASISLGRPHEAFNLFLNPNQLQDRERRIKDIIKMANSSLNVRFQYAKELVEQSDLKEVLETWLRYFRYSLLAKNKIDSGDLPVINYSSPKLRKIIKFLQNNLFLILNTNINKRLALENLLIEL